MDETEQPAAAAEAPKTDSQGRELMTVPGGRILSLRPANDMLSMMDVAEAAGVDGRGQPTDRVLHNPIWMGNAQIACQVAAIDGVPEPFPRSVTEIRALVGKLGAPAMGRLTTRWGESGRDVNEEAAKN